MLSQVVELIESKHRFLITGHARPDGDSIGSSLALYWGLRALHKDVVVVMRDPIPQPIRNYLVQGKYKRARQLTSFMTQRLSSSAAI